MSDCSRVHFRRLEGKMILWESELTRPSNNLRTIDRRQAALREMLHEAERTGAPRDTILQLRMYVNRWDRQRDRVKAIQDEIL